MKIKAFPKINLALDVLKKSASGKHKIQTVYLEIKNIHDTIEIKEAKVSNDTSTSNDLIFQAIQLFKKETGVKKFFKVKIKKAIPFSSGLGGVSSDAAAVLKALNKLCKAKLSQKKLLSLSSKLGSDVPFFIIGGCAFGTNFGEKLTPLPLPKNLKIKLILPKRKTFPPLNKTANAYAALDLKLCGRNKNKTRLLVKALKTNSKKLILENIHNDFETLFAVPEKTNLCGSGPATFRIRSSR